MLTIALLLLSSPTVHAQTLDISPELSAVRSTLVTVPVAVPHVPVADRPEHSTGMRGLYIASGVLHALDLYSTRMALSAGAQEANPLMRGAVGNTAAYVTIKAAATAGTIFLMEKARKRNPVAAIVAMAAINSAYFVIVMHNVRVAGAASSQRGVQLR